MSFHIFDIIRTIVLAGAWIIPTHGFTATGSATFLKKTLPRDVTRQTVNLQMSASNGGVVITGGAAGM
jgi:hypothetical protein